MAKQATHGTEEVTNSPTVDLGHPYGQASLLTRARLNDATCNCNRPGCTQDHAVVVTMGCQHRPTLVFLKHKGLMAVICETCRQAIAFRVASEG